MKLALALAATISAAALAAGANAATDRLANGGFETGDFTGWTETGNTDYSGVVSGGAQEGDFYAVEGAVGSNDVLSQSFRDVAGRVYTVSGWIASDGGVASEFAMVIDGATQVLVENAPAQDWTHYTFDFVGSGHDTFAVGTRDDQGLLSIDHFSITSSVP